MRSQRRHEETTERAPHPLPDWLYESLPFVYAVSGLMIIFFVGNFVALASGSLLLSAAALVAYMRLEHRFPSTTEHDANLCRAAPRRRLPTWLYESLPFIYVAGGLLVPVILPDITALVAAAMLLSAGITVFAMRRRHRRALHGPRPAVDAVIVSRHSWRLPPGVAQRALGAPRAARLRRDRADRPRRRYGPSGTA